jgi:hypothetical protein
MGRGGGYLGGLPTGSQIAARLRRANGNVRMTPNPKNRNPPNIQHAAMKQQKIIHSTRPVDTLTLLQGGPVAKPAFARGNHGSSRGVGQVVVVEVLARLRRVLVEPEAMLGRECRERGEELPAVALAHPPAPPALRPRDAPAHDALDEWPGLTPADLRDEGVDLLADRRKLALPSLAGLRDGVALALGGR